MKPNTDATINQIAADGNKTNNGARHDASTSAVVTESQQGELVWQKVGFIESAIGYSKALGFGGGGGGTKVAFSSRSISLARAAAGFCHSRSTSFMASLIGNRTNPLV